MTIHEQEAEEALGKWSSSKYAVFNHAFKSYGPYKEWGGQLQAFFKYEGKLYYTIRDEGTFSIDRDGDVEKVSDFEMFWGHIRWGDYMYTGYEYAGEIYRFDGKSFEKVHTEPDINRFIHFSPYDYEDRLYATGKEGITVWTEDGTNWTRDTGIDTLTDPDKNYSLGQLTDLNDLFSFEVSGSSPARVLRKSDGGAWAEQKSYGGIENVGPMWETPCGRQNFWLNLRNPRKDDFLWCGSHTNRAFLWDGSKLLELFRANAPQSGYGAAVNPAQLVKPLNVEGYMLIVVGTGGPRLAKGEVWLWDGLQLYRVLELPFRVNTAELFAGYLWIAGNTATIRTTNKKHQDGVQTLYTHNEGHIIALPLETVIEEKELPPQSRVVWDDFSASANTTYYSDDDGGVMIPCQGYDKAMIHLNNTQTFDWAVEVDPNGQDDWYEYKSESGVSGYRTYRIDGPDFAFLRLKVVQGGTAGTLNGTVNLE